MLKPLFFGYFSHLFEKSQKSLSKVTVEIFFAQNGKKIASNKNDLPELPPFYNLS